MNEAHRLDQMSAMKLYEILEKGRQNYEYRAEDSSLLTIPSLIPQYVSRDGSMDLPKPRQSLGAMGVNSLANKIMMALFPATQSFFRYEVDPQYREEIASEEDQSKVEKALKEREDAIHLEIIRRTIRAPMTESIKHNIVGGNVLYYFGRDRFQYFPLKRHVVERDADSDDWKHIVTKEVVSLLSLSDDLQTLAKESNAQHHEQRNVTTGSSETDVDIYTKVWRDDKNVYWQQEFSSGAVLPGTKSQAPKDLNPWQPVPWTLVEGENYGRGHVEDAIGDLINFERLTQAAVELAVGSARLVGLVAPNGQTMPEDINNAKNGEFVPGLEGDISFLQVNKQGDARISEAILQRLEERLNAHFLISEVRDAERVTAEEVRMIQRELNSNLSGQFANLAQRIQLPLVRTIEAELERRGDLPKIPKAVKQHITPVVVTGVEALGRAADLERLQVAISAVQQMVGPEQAAQYLNIGAIFEYALTNAGADVPGAVKTDEQLAQEQAAAQQQALIQSAVDKGTGPAIQAASNAQQAPQPTPA